jgi:hypothetical protein
MRISFQKYPKIVKFFVVFAVVLMTMGVFDVLAYVYNENPSTFGNFPKAGELRVYYKDFLSGPGYNMLITKDGVSKSFSLPGYQNQSMLDTGIQVAPGDIITVDIVEADVDGGECVGWIAVQDNKCGSGLPDGNGGNYPIIDVSQWVNWANQAGEPLVSRQCWGDWPEWSGDLDFDDFLIIFSYAPAPVAVPTVDLKANGFDGPITIQYNTAATLTWLTTNNPTTCAASNGWSGNKNVSGGSESTGNLTSHKTYKITCSNSAGSDDDEVLVQVIHCLPTPPPPPL